MTHGEPADEMTELAALYALGALTQHEVRRFEEHLAEGCRNCRAEVAGFEQVTFNLAFGAPEVEPPVGAFDKLLNLTESEERRPAVARNPVSIRASDFDWEQVSEGVSVKRLFEDPSSGVQTSLVRMAGGTHLPTHRHIGVEQFYVLEGDCTVNGERLGPGDYHRAEAGSIHDETSTEFGTLLLLVAPASYEVIDSR
jgi:anti-sigma factor ChrR (cupin superfamily)